jgi:hypothetical protein
LTAVLLVWLAATLPLLLGTSTLVTRDVFGVHLPLKAFGAGELAEGRIPYFNPTWGLGEPFRGDPNALPLYPGNLLYLVLPFWSAFNAHYGLHWLLAFFTMRALARELRMGPDAALMASLTYAGSGWMLSNLTFYNIISVAAWWPLVALGVVRRDRRGLAIGGLACGLALLGGDPVAAVIGVPVLLVAASGAHDWRHVLGRIAAVGSIGLLAATPQIVATARVLGFSTRTAISSAAAEYALHPLRLLELLVPLPWGDPTTFGPGRLLIGALFDQTPFVLTIHIGIAALVLALAAVRRQKRWALLGTIGLIVAWLGGPLEAAGQGLFRYPEKFLFWFAFAAAVLAGHGLEAIRERSLSPVATAALLGLCGLVTLVMLLIGDRIIAWLGSGLPSEVLAQSEPVSQERLLVAVAISALLCLATLWTARRGQVALVILLQLICLVRLYPLVQTDSTGFYREPAPWARRVGTGASVLMGVGEPAVGGTEPAYALSEHSKRQLNRIRHLDLDFPTGVMHGLRYPVHHEGAGLGSPLLAIVRRNLGNLDWPGRTNWFRVLGLQHVTTTLSQPPRGWRVVDRVVRSGVPTTLLAVPEVAPEVWWPTVVHRPPNADEAYRHVITTDDPVGSVVAPTAREHIAGASVRLLEEGPDLLRIAVSGEGGILAVRRAYHPLLQASIGGQPARTLPLQLALLGVEIPAGDHVVEIAVSKRPDRLALLGPAAALLTAGFLWRPTGRRPRPRQRPRRPGP